MKHRKLLLILLVAGFVSAVCIEQAFSQQGRRGRRGDQTDAQAQQGRRGDRTDAQTAEQRAERMEQWRARAAEQMRESLGATEEEWEVLSPLVEQVQTLSRQLRAGAMVAGRWGRRRPGAGDEDEADAPPLTDIEAAVQALRELADSDTATDEELQEAMEALRTAKAAVETELTAAQDALRDAVTVRQEAQLVLMGLLD